MQGSHQAAVFTMSDRSVRSGPEVPMRNNHGLGAMSPDGRMHALVSADYLLPSEDPSGKIWLRHFVWDFASGDLLQTMSQALLQFTSTSRQPRAGLPYEKCSCQH